MNRIVREKNKNFTIISNTFLRDETISLKSKGLLALIMGLPEDWDFTINGIVKITKEGKTAMYNAINELKEHGYCVVNTCRDEHGKIMGNDYTFYEEPFSYLQGAEEQDMGNPNLGNQPQLSTNSNKENKEESTYDEHIEKDWRNDFDVYVSMVNDAKQELLKDRDFFDNMVEFHPNVDFYKTIDKMVTMYWATENGWKNKKKKRTKNIDMLSTLKNGYSSINFVYLQKGQSNFFKGSDVDSQKFNKKNEIIWQG